MFNLKIIITSTRPGRKGPAIAAWFHEVAKRHPEFNTQLIDLADINLPMFDEPFHPMLRKYQHEHTKNWSAIIDDADAVVWVAPEYNYSFNAAFKNAFDYLHHEWKHKPAGVVSYGGVSAGTRALQMIKLVLASGNMMPITESVNIPFFAKLITPEGVFQPPPESEKAAEAMLNALAKWAAALRPMREQKASA